MCPTSSAERIFLATDGWTLSDKMRAQERFTYVLQTQ